MFRITIDNEEVLCDKDITIKEEMLNTPSVILNNVYPKTWEASKDYTTNFYHPDDYSKCVIADQDYIAQSDGTTVEGTNLQVNYDDRRNFEYYLKGDTYQYTTTGKNLFNKDGNLSSYTANANKATVSKTDDKITFTANAQNATGFYTVNNTFKNYIDGFSTSKTYTISADITISANTQLKFAFESNATIKTFSGKQRISNTSTSSSVSSAFVCYLYGATTGTTVTIENIMIEENSTATTYEPYTNGASPNPSYPQEVVNATGRQEISVCGKNLLEIVDGTYSHNHVDNVCSNGEITINGTATSNSFSTIINKKIFLTQGTYTLSANNPVAYGTTSLDLRIVNESGTVIASTYMNTVNGKKTFTVSNDIYNCSLQVRAGSGDSFNNFKLKPQLEKGNQSTSYEIFNGKKYEINLGKNLLNLTEGTYSSYGIYAVVSNGKITISGTATSNAFVNIPYATKPNINIGDTITVSANNPVANSNVRIRIDTNGTMDTILSNINQTQKINISTTLSTNFIIRVQNGTTIPTSTPFEFTPMIEKGSVATTYSPYKTPIELCKIGNYQDFIRKGTGKNLWNAEFERAEYNSSGVKVDTTVWLVNTTKINVIPNTQYTISQSQHPIQYRIICFNGSTYLSQLQNSTNTTTGYSSYTFTTPNNCNGIYIQFRSTIERIAKGTYKVEVGDITQAQLEKGSTASVYEPYGYKDKWYLYKAIGKVVLNGSESWNYEGGRFVLSFLISALDIAGRQEVYSNYFKYLSSSSADYGIFVYKASSTNYQIYIYDKDYTTASNFQTWLSTHNTTVYYVLSTPYTMEITDSELLGQLNAVNLLTGLNNISLSSPYRPAILNLHYNFNDAYYYTNELYFCGVVKNSGNISLNPREPHFQTLQILDFKTFLSEGETLDRVIVDKTILETIQEVVGVISGYGFVLGNVQIANPNDIIGAYSTENKTAYDIFNYIAEITQSKWTTRLVDENTVAIDFYDPSALPQGTPIEYNTTYFKNNQIDNMFYSYSANDYRNKQIMTSKEVFANIDTKETIISSGYGSNFLLQQPVGQVESITLNNVEMSFATKQDKELGYSADFYYSVGSESIESDINIPLGSAIVVQYIPIVAGRQVIANDSEISRISGATGRNGIITRYENRNDASTSNELQMIGQSYIKYKGSPEIKLTVETRSNLWKIGDRVQFNAPIPELATEYMVKSKQIEYIKTIDDVFYTFEMSSSFNSEQDINYFDNQRAKALGNIKEGSYISRNIDIENVANIVFQNATLEKINSTGDNKLNSTLNSPLVQ